MIEQTELALPNPYANNPYETAPKPPKKKWKFLLPAMLLLFLVSMAITGFSTYSVGANSILVPTPIPTVDTNATATESYNNGYGQGQVDTQTTAIVQATAAYNQGTSDDSASYLKWLKDKCTKDTNGNYTVFIKNNELWCY